MATPEKRLRTSCTYACHACLWAADSPDAILQHCISQHVSLKFSLRVGKLCDTTGQYIFKSVHFPVTVKHLKERGENGDNPIIDIDTKTIRYVRIQDGSSVKQSSDQSQNEDPTIEEDHSEIVTLFNCFLDKLKASNKERDLISLMKAVVDGRLSMDNITLHLVLDVGKLLRPDSLASMRYDQKTMDFWLVVYRMFKGRGIRFFRGYMAEGQHKRGLISPDHCSFNFAVPTEKTLAKAGKVFQVDAGTTGILEEPLKSFAAAYEGADCKLALDGKKIAFGYGDKFGEEDLAGHEQPPTLASRKERLDNEISHIQKITDQLKGLIDVNRSDSIKCLQPADNISLAISTRELIHILSTRIQELRQMDVKTNRRITSLMKRVDGPSWMLSKVANGISFFKSKSIQTNDAIKALLNSVDDLAYYLSVLSGTEDEYVRGEKVRVDLEQQTNYVCLRSLSTQCIDALDRDDSSVFRYIKQRTPEWHSIRKTAVVTGSTLFSALGLDTLKERKIHFDAVFKGIEKTFTPEAQSAMKHGTTNEINAVATIVAKILPALYPKYKFVEDGCIVHRTDKSTIVISGDGTLVSDGEDKTDNVAVEIKCPMPGKQFTTDVFYSLPKRYTTQVLSQMGAKGCTSYLLVCFNPDSTTVITGNMENDLWLSVLSLVDELYGLQSSRPTKTDPRSQTLLTKLKQYAGASIFVAELPSLYGVECNHTIAEKVEDALMCHTNVAVNTSNESMSDLTSSVCSTQERLQQAYDLLRRPAKEVLLTVISDLDRQGHPNKPEAMHAVPIMLHMSGFSLKMSSVRKIINDGIRQCKEKGLNIRIVAYDGQFLELSVEDSSQHPLTLVKFQKQVWNKASAVAKRDQVNHLSSFNDIGTITDSKCIEEHMVVSRSPNGALVVKSRTQYTTLVTPRNISSYLNMKNAESGEDVGTKSCDTQLSEDVQEMIDAVTNMDDDVQGMPIDGDSNAQRDDDIVSPQSDDEFINELNEDATVEENVGKSLNNNHPDDVAQSKTIDDTTIEQLLTQLICVKEAKWMGVSPSKFKDMLKTASSINKHFTIPELHLLMDAAAIPFTKKIKKPQMVNLVSRTIGDASIIPQKRSSPKQLKSIIKQQLLNKWPKKATTIVYALQIYPKEYQEWSENAPFQNGATILTEHECFQIPFWYAQPENPDGDLLQHVIDPHHLFVNSRVRCCTKGMPAMNIYSNAWFKVAKEEATNNTGLSLQLVKELPDKQRNSYAQTTFCFEVEQEMRLNGDIEEAEWCRLIRNWYRAVDDAGIPEHVRISYLLDMRKYLLSLLDVNVFPPPGSFVKDLPITQFEGILGNIDRRLQLYAMVNKSSYNQRSISSLDSETFFSGFQDYDPKGNGVLRADDIPIAIGSALCLVSKKMNTKRPFLMRTSKRIRQYDDHNMEAVEDSNDDSSRSTLSTTGSNVITVKTHSFDVRCTKKPKRKSGRIMAPRKLGVGAQGVREFHRVNEEKILFHRRAGIRDEDII